MSSDFFVNIFYLHLATKRKKAWRILWGLLDNKNKEATF